MHQFKLDMEKVDPNIGTLAFLHMDKMKGWDEAPSKHMSVRA